MPDDAEGETHFSVDDVNAADVDQDCFEFILAYVDDEVAVLDDVDAGVQFV